MTDRAIETLQLFVTVQLLVTLFLCALFWSMHRGLGGQAFFRWWAWAWTAFALFLASGAASLHLGATWSWMKGSLILVSVLSGYLHIVLLLFGGQSLVGSGSPTARSQRVGFALALGAGGLCFAVAVAIRSDTLSSFAVRTAPRTLALALTFFYCALVLGRIWRASGSRAAVVTALFCVAYGVEELIYGLAYTNQLLVA